MAELKIGDQILHPVYGIGTLISIEKRADDGVMAEYYVIELERGNGILATPVEKAEELGLRKPISKEDRDRLAEVFAGRPNKLPDDYRKRRSTITARLRDGDFVEIGQVVRDLAWLKMQGHASMGDHRLRKRAEELLAVELAAADGIGLDNAKERIDSVLEQTLSKYEHQDA